MTDIGRSRSGHVSPSVTQAARALVAAVGESEAVSRLRLARGTVARLVGGMPVAPSTLCVAAQRLGVDLSSEGRP